MGGVGHESVAQLYNDSELKECMDNGELGLPPAGPLENDMEDMQYFFRGDDAFFAENHHDEAVLSKGKKRCRECNQHFGN